MTGMGMIAVATLAGVALSACTRGGQSFDDGRDGVSVGETRNESPAVPDASPPSPAGPEPTSAPEPDDDEVPLPERIDAAVSVGPDSDDDEPSDDDVPDDEPSDDDVPDDDVPDDEPSGDDVPDDDVPDDDVAETEMDAGPTLGPITSGMACLFQQDGELRVQLIHTCGCPDRYRCSASSANGLISVEGYELVDQPVCPPACFLDIADCPFSETGDAPREFRYGATQVAFEVDELPTEVPEAMEATEEINGFCIPGR